jgi:hypothetical protein
MSRKTRLGRNDSGQRLVAVVRRACAVSLILQDARDQFADIRFVVNDQDVGCRTDNVNG